MFAAMQQNNSRWRHHGYKALQSARVMQQHCDLIYIVSRGVHTMPWTVCNDYFIQRFIQSLVAWYNMTWSMCGWRSKQQNFYSISTVTTWWLDSDRVVTIINCCSIVTILPLAAQSQCCMQLAMVTTPSLSSDRVVTVPSRWLME